jgi:hypothetical protein
MLVHSSVSRSSASAGVWNRFSRLCQASGFSHKPRTKLVTPAWSGRIDIPAKASVIHMKVLARPQAGRNNRAQRYHSSHSTMADSLKGFNE